jgi:hypothetical protein
MTPYKLPECLAIDPGPETEHGIVSINPAGDVIPYDWSDFDGVRKYCENNPAKTILIEGLSNYGSPVGDTVLRTAYTIGRLFEIANNGTRKVCVIRRVDIRVALLGAAKGNDSIIRQNILERFGGPTSAKKGGPLSGIKGHSWAALAIVVAYREMLEVGAVKAVRM